MEMTLGGRRVAERGRGALLASSTRQYRMFGCRELERRSSVAVRRRVQQSDVDTDTKGVVASSSSQSSSSQSSSPSSSQSPSPIPSTDQQTPEGDTGTLWGAMALIIGSTIGAGILALPDISQEAGFVTSTGGLVGVWAFLVAQALLLAEVNINIYWADKPNCTLVSSSDDEDGDEPMMLTDAVVVCDRRGDRARLDGFRGFADFSEFGGDRETAKNNNTNMTTLRAMAERTLGKNVGRLTTSIYLSLSYCLLVAYLSKVAEMFSFVTDGRVDADWVVIDFVLASLALFSLGGQRATDRLNQWLTFSLVASFMSILGIGIGAELSSGHHVGSLVHVSGAELMHLPPALPIMFLSLVYHDLIPFICSYLNGDATRIRQALVLGSVVPLLMFVSWEGVTLSFLENFLENFSGTPGAVGAPHADPVTLLISESGNPFLGTLITSFSFMAIATSFLGTVMGVSETIYSEGSEVLEMNNRKKRGERGERGDGDGTVVVGGDDRYTNDNDDGIMSSLGDRAIRNASLALTLVPPLIFTTRGDPSSFISALSLAGGYGMTLLYGILPPMMAFVNRREEGSGRLLVGGETPLFFLGACGLGFFGLRLAEDVLHVF